MQKMFTRDMVLFGPPTPVREWAVGIARKFEQVTGREVAVWTSLAGGTNGHYTWSMPLDGANDIVEFTMQAFGDQDYLDLIEEGRQFFTGPAHDTIYRPYRPVHDQGSEIGNVAVVTTAESKAGSLGHAVGWGIETAEYVSRLTGIETALLGNSAGRFSRLTWMGVAEDAAAADAASDTWSQDDEYLKLIARGGGYFVSGSARTQFFLRIG